MALLGKSAGFAVWAAGYATGLAAAGLIMQLVQGDTKTQLALARAEICRLQLMAYRGEFATPRAIGSMMADLELELTEAEIVGETS